jgi:hypothetical protein
MSITLSLSGGGEKSRQAPAGRGPGDGGAVRVSRPRAVTHGSRQPAAGSIRARRKWKYIAEERPSRMQRGQPDIFFLLLAQVPITV